MSQKKGTDFTRRGVFYSQTAETSFQKRYRGFCHPVISVFLKQENLFCPGENNSF